MKEDIEAGLPHRINFLKLFMESSGLVGDDLPRRKTLLDPRRDSASLSRNEKIATIIICVVFSLVCLVLWKILK